MGRPYLTWMDTAMHDMGCLGHLLHDMGSLGHYAADRPSTRLGDPSTVPGHVEGGGQPVLSCEQCFVLLQVLLSFLHLMLGA